MTEQLVKGIIGVGDSPVGVYLGSQRMEGYCKLLTAELEIEQRCNQAIETASQAAIKAAVRRAHVVSEGSKPACPGAITTLSIRISVPVAGASYNEKTIAASLPDAARQLVTTVAEGEKYTIIVMSVVWTARWVCLPPGGMDGLPKDSVTPSKGKTWLGNNAYDFGCPHPSKDKVVTVEKVYAHNPLRKSPVITRFKAAYPQNVKQLEDEIRYKTFYELDTAIAQLPKCPPECTPGDLSVTLGYPEPYMVTGEETSKMIDKKNYEMVDGKYQEVIVKVEQFTHTVKGRWSWSVQRACGS